MTAAEPLPAREKLAYGAGDLGMSIAYTVVVLFFLYYLTDVVGLSPALAGIAVMLGRVWDAVSDPLAGHLSDHTRSRWGRRKPYLLLTAVPFGLSFALLWSVPALPGQAMTFAWVAGVFLAHTTLFTLVGVPYSALTAELTPDYDQRTSLSAYRMAFSIGGGLVAAVIPMALVGAFASVAGGFRVMGFTMGVVCALTPLVVVFGCRTPAPAVAPPTRMPLGESTRITLANRPFRAMLAVYLLTWAGIDVVSTVLIYFLTYWMGMEADIPASWAPCS
ncbi:MAG: MFS transporter [bacterium]|nr:MFS transporter [bacterium]